MQQSSNSPFARPKGLLAVLAAAIALTTFIAACGGGEPEELTFNLEIEQRTLSEEDATIEVKQDDKLTIVMTSDEPVNYHLHGYDLEGNAGPDMPATLEFDAYATGSFPLTIHVPAQPSTADSAEMSGEPGLHAATIEAPQDMSVSVEVELDALSGVNLTIDTTGFKFAPQNVDGPHVQGEGHAHVYVDGVKIGRVYGPHYYLDHIEPGERTIRVSLNANSHEEYAKGHDSIEAIANVTVGSGGGHQHGSDASGGDSTPTDDSPTVAAPEEMSVQIVATPDSGSGVNIELVTTGFTFAPQNVNGDHVEGEGHAHVYVDGVKITRLYGPYYHLDNIDPGERTISVILNANTHQEYAIGDEIVEANTMVVVESSGSDGHAHSHGDGSNRGEGHEEEIELGRLVVQPR